MASMAAMVANNLKNRRRFQRVLFEFAFLLFWICFVFLIEHTRLKKKVALLFV